MKVRYVDNKTPRVDGKPFEPTGLTLNRVYSVYRIDEDKNHGKMYVVINDNLEISRYVASRFVSVSGSKTTPRDLTKDFNSIISKITSRIYENIY